MSKTFEMNESYKEKLEQIKEDIKSTMDLNDHNVQRFNKFRNLIFKSSLSDAIRNTNKALDRPNLEFNIAEAYASRLCDDYSSADPAISISIDDRTKPTQMLLKMTDVVEGHIRYVLTEAKSNGINYDIFMESVTGGFSAAKVLTEYNNNMSFEQCIKFDKVYWPPMVFFDPLARDISKKDGRYCGELYPMWAEEAEEKYGIDLKKIKFTEGGKGFKWYYKIGERDVVVIADYYEKKEKAMTIYKLSNGKTVRKDEYEEGETKDEIPQMADLSGQSNAMQIKPTIVDERTSMDEVIVRYKLFGRSFIEKPKETDLPGLPYVHFQANSVLLGNNERNTEEVSRPYLYHIEGAQKLFDSLGITLANECQRLSQQKMVVFAESINPQYADTITNPSQYESIIVNAYDHANANKPLPPPFQIQRNAFPPELFALFQYIPTLFQNILGSFDNQMGQGNNNDLSGQAIIQSQMHSLSSAKPLVVRNLQSLTRVAELIVALIPKYFVTPMTIPVIDKEGKHDFVKLNDPEDQNSIQLDYDPHNLHVKVEAGPSFSVQKTQAMMQLTALSKSMPVFGQFMNEKGLKILLDNLDIRGTDLLKVLADEYMKELQQRMQQQQQMAQQQAQNTPAMLHEQREAKKDAIGAQIDMGRLEIEKGQLAIDQAKLHLQAIDLGNQHALEADKLKHEKKMGIVEMHHKIGVANHQKEIQKGELGNKIIQTIHQKEANEAKVKMTSEKNERN